MILFLFLYFKKIFMVGILYIINFDSYSFLNLRGFGIQLFFKKSFEIVIKLSWLLFYI